MYGIWKNMEFLCANNLNKKFIALGVDGDPNMLSVEEGVF